MHVFVKLFAAIFATLIGQVRDLMTVLLTTGSLALTTELGTWWVLNKYFLKNKRRNE